MAILDQKLAETLRDNPRSECAILGALHRCQAKGEMPDWQGSEGWLAPRNRSLAGRSFRQAIDLANRDGYYPFLIHTAPGNKGIVDGQVQRLNRREGDNA